MTPEALALTPGGPWAPEQVRGEGLLPWARDTFETWLEIEREQLPLWLPVAFGCGIAAWFVLPGRTAWTVAALATAGLALAVLAIARDGRLGRALALAALSAAAGIGTVWWKAERVAAPVLARPVVTTFDAIVERVEPQPAKQSVRLLLAPAAAALPPRLRLTVDEDKAPPGLAAGARVAVRARLVPPPGAALPSAYDYARVAWFQGVGATGRALDPVRLTAPPTADWRAGLAGWRQRLSGHIQAALPGPAGAIAAALATGDTGGLPEEDSEAMRRSGLAHLLSVSGLHLTAVVAAAMLVTMRLLALSRTLALRTPLPLIAAGVAALAGVGYTLMTGAEVPTVRSCIAALLVLLGIALGREAMTLRLVATGALVVLLLWPESLVGPSFQLSFAAITAIVALHDHPAVARLLARRDEGRGRALARAGLGLLLTGVAVELALAPIALFHFHRTGLYGALANIVAIPLTTFVVMPLEALALLLDLAGLGSPAWWLAGRALALLLALAHGVAAMPGAVALMPAMPRAAFGLMIGGMLWLALWRTRVRRTGLLPLAAGALMAATAPAADLFVTGDGRHVAVRTTDGGVALLRPRAGDYVRRTLGELVGTEAEALDMDALPRARCTADLCAAEVARGGRRWRLLATRSRYLVDPAALARACRAADIVVSDRRLPRGCRPRWLKADRPLLARTGGLAIDLDRGGVETVAAGVRGHPWAETPPSRLPAGQEKDSIGTSRNRR